MSACHVFLYGPQVTGELAGQLAACERVGRALLRGTLYDVPGAGRVLMLYGDTPVPGEIWRCPAASLAELDRAAGTDGGRLRRVARLVASVGNGDGVACWLYVVGPRLARELLPERRVSPADMSS